MGLIAVTRLSGQLFIILAQSRPPERREGETPGSGVVRGLRSGPTLIRSLASSIASPLCVVAARAEPLSKIGFPDKKKERRERLGYEKEKKKIVLMGPTIR